MTPPLDLDAIESRWMATHRYEGPWTLVDGDTPAIETKVRTIACVYEHGDAEFLAHAHQDVPALIALVRTQRKLLRALLKAPHATPSFTGRDCIHCRGTGVGAGPIEHEAECPWSLAMEMEMEESCATART